MSRYGDPGPSFEEFTRTMVWPRLLKSAGLALRPARIGLSLVLLLCVGLVANAPSLWLGKNLGPAPLIADSAVGGMRTVQRSVLEGDLPLLADGLRRIFLAGPLEALREHPWSSLAIGVPVLLLWGLLGGAVSRLAAEEHALDKRSHWTSGMAFAVSRWVSLAGCTLGPAIAMTLACLALAAAGWVLLRFTYVDAVGGVLYAIMLLVGMCAAVLGLAALLGLPMLVPALACEGTDAVDAVQRVLAYTLARPGRLALYLLLLIAQLVFALWALGLVVSAGEALTAWAASQWLPSERAEGLREAAVGTVVTEGADASTRFSRRTISFWHAVPNLLIASYAVSFMFSAGSVLYLCMRRVCDGQDAGELWRPSMTPGTVPTETPRVPDEDDAG